MGSRTRATISSAGRGCSRSRTTAASSGTGDVVQVRRRSNASCPAPSRAQPQETCMFLSVVSIGTVAALGAWLRWGLGLWLNPHHATLPLEIGRAHVFTPVTNAPLVCRLLLGIENR